MGGISSLKNLGLRYSTTYRSDSLIVDFVYRQGWDRGPDPAVDCVLDATIEQWGDQNAQHDHYKHNGPLCRKVAGERGR